MNGWKEITIAKGVELGFLEKPLDGNHGEIHPKGNDFIDTGIPFIMASDIKKGKVDLVNCSFISEKQALSLRKGFSRNGDVLLTHKATLGEVALLKTDLEFVMLTPQVTYYRVINDKEIYNIYLKYYFESSFFQKTLEQYAGGSTRAYIGITKQLDLPLILPPIQEQKAIAKVLTAFDDKIENLRAQNQTLEQTAQTIFKEWFGKYQIGDELPEGWRVGKLGDFKATIVDFVANGSFASLKENVTLYEEQEYALFIRNTDLKSNFKEKKYVDKKSYDFLSKSKLFGGEIIISNVGDVGSVHFCPHFDIPMTLGNNVIMLNSDFQFYFYTFFNSRIGQHLIETITGGSAQPKFNKTDFRNMGMVIPSEEILNNFENLSSKLYDKLLKNREQIQTLTQTRNALLPKLMRGEIRVNGFKK